VSILGLSKLSKEDKKGHIIKLIKTAYYQFGDSFYTYLERRYKRVKKFGCVAGVSIMVLAIAADLLKR